MEEHLPGCTSSQKHQLLVTVLDPQHWDFLPIMGPLASPYTPGGAPEVGTRVGHEFFPARSCQPPSSLRWCLGQEVCRDGPPPCECSSSPAPSTPASPRPTGTMASVSRSLLGSGVLRMGPILQEHRAGTPIPSARCTPWSGGGCCHCVLLILLFLLPAGWRLSGEQQQETTGRDN